MGQGGIEKVQHLPVKGRWGLGCGPALVEDAGFVVPVVVGQAQGADQLFLDQVVPVPLGGDVGGDDDDGSQRGHSTRQRRR